MKFNALGMHSIGKYDIVYSPDDNGYYLQEFDFEKKRDRVSRKLYAKADDAKRALETGKVRWEAWRP